MAVGEQIADSHFLVPLSPISLTTALSLFSWTAFFLMLDFIFYLNMEVAHCSETLVLFLPKYVCTVSHNSLYIHCCESITPHMMNVTNDFPCH
jgi:hypothetical protein